MPKLIWDIINHTQSDLDVTQYVRSLSFTQGRVSPLSPYSGNSATITMSSYGGIENYVAINDEIYIGSTPTGGPGQFLFIGRVTSRIFDDNPGSGINSTMIVSLNDAMLQAGMANFQNQSLVSVNEQINEIDILLPQIDIFQYATDVNISTGTFTTNANQRINEIIAGDRGILQNNSGTAVYLPPSTFDSSVNVLVGFAPTTSASQIGYQDLTRVEAASNSLFYTQATVTGSASTETKNSADLATYGTRTFTATTAQSNKVSETAEWYANTFTDPESVMLNLSFSDVAQNETALQNFNNLCSFTNFVEVSYTPPGGDLTTGYYWPEQITFNATPDQTSITMLMSPLTYYANFILDDAVFGVLGGSGITYNQPEIIYNETGWIYNDTNVEQGSRLGV
jgi:hypothetical protein